jgi:hypothetical protein
MFSMHFHVIEQFIRSWAINAVAGYVLHLFCKWIWDAAKMGAAMLTLVIANKLLAAIFPDEEMRHYVRAVGLILICATAVGVSLGNVPMLRDTR